MVKSFVNCYSVFKNEEIIKKYIDVEKVLSNFKELSAKITSTTAKNKNECFSKILQENLDFINKFIKYLELKDCPSHSELYHHIQKSQDEILCIPSTAILPAAGLKRYQDYLRKRYRMEVDGDVKVETDGMFNNNIDINQFVNLSLIKPQDKANNNEYFEALNEPHHLLFNHEECTNTNTTPIKSLAEIFDTSGSVTQKILIHGSPGSGKTTLAHKICIEWAKGNLIQHYTLVILLNLRDVKIRDIESIDDMVDRTMGDDCASEVVGDITCIDGKNVLLVLEGWDELPEDKQLKKSFFANTIAGKVLKKVSVIITSRPSSIGTIEKAYITRNVAILGFSEDQIEQYVDQCFADSSHGAINILKRRFMDELNTNPVLKSLAYVPVNLKILVYVFKKYESKLPNTLTELYQHYVLLKLRLYNQRKSGRYHEFTFNEIPNYISKKLKILYKLAYDGIETQALSINDDTVTKELDKDGMGLLQVSHYLLLDGSDKTYDFIHKTVQEFLAAEYLRTIPVQEQKNIFLKCKLNKDFLQVLFFYAGLTGLKLFDLRELLPTAFVNTKSLYDKAADFVLPSLSNIMIKDDELKFASKSDMARDYAKCNNNNELCVLISCIAEAKNPAACKALSNSEVFHEDLCFINIPNSAITSQLLVSLSYCIANSGRNWAVKCKSKILGKSEILSLQKYLIDSNSTSGKLWHLDVKSNRKEIKYLTNFLQPQFTVCELGLCYSLEFDDDCVSILCSELTSNQTLEGLDLRYCNISSKGIRIIAKMLQVNKALRSILLESNYFSHDDLIQALVIMKNNTTLLMMMTDKDFSEDEKVIKQLQIFNQKRTKPLMLNKYHAFRFSTVLSKLDFLGWSRS